MLLTRKQPGRSVTRGLAWLWYPALFALAVRGQDALFSSVSLEQSTAARTVALTGQPYLGPVQLAAGAFAGVTWDDDINEAQYNPETDETLTGGVNLGLAWSPTGQSELQAGGSISYVNYLKYRSNSGLEISPDSALTYAISVGDVTVTFFDQLSYTRRVQTEAALANVASLPQINNNVGLEAEWDLGHWVFLGSYSHDDADSSGANDYLNRSSEYFLARAGWQFAEATQAGMEVSDSLTAYQVDSANNNQNISVGGYLNWSVRPFLTVTLRGGPLFYVTQSGASGGSSSLNSYYVSFRIDHKITDFLSHSLDVERSLQAGVNQGGGYFEQLTGTYSINWSLTRRITLGASVTYTDGQQPLTQFFQLYPYPIYLPIQITEDYREYSGSLQASWRFTDHLSASVSVGELQRNSNLSGRNYSDDTVSFQLQYRF